MKIRFLVTSVLSLAVILSVFSLLFLYTYYDSEDYTVNAIQGPNEKINLIIDPGHGGADGGAVSITGTYESVINLSIAIKAEQISALLGYNPILTRYSDVIDYPEDAVTIRAKKVADQKSRVSLITSTANPVLISIHQNKYTSSGPYGAQVFYSNTDGSNELAEHLQLLLSENTDTGKRNSAVQIPDSIYLMNAINCPGVLVECGFLSNESEANLLEDNEYQLKLAIIIIGGTVGFLNQLK